MLEIWHNPNMERTLRLGLIVLSIGLLATPACGQTAEPPRPAARVDGPLGDSLPAFAGRMGRLLRDRETNAVLSLYGDTAHFVHVENGVIIP
ncbi:MAG TPA: hypothetical protein VHE78_04220 [Gemmatimonadaceae bacterium]|nr:hypothetical protein [Gemmatimonadaceae bacterium]